MNLEQFTTLLEQAAQMEEDGIIRQCHSAYGNLQTMEFCAIGVCAWLHQGGASWSPLEFERSLQCDPKVVMDIVRCNDIAKESFRKIARRLRVLAALQAN